MRKVVYLTFDDGPSENTKKLMDILAKYIAKSHFLCKLVENQNIIILLKMPIMQDIRLVFIPTVTITKQYTLQ